MHEHLVFYWRAFNELSSDRPLGSSGGAGSIPWTAIDRYATRHGIGDPDAFDRFMSLIRAMDRVYLDYAADQAKEGERKKPKT